MKILDYKLVSKHYETSYGTEIKETLVSINKDFEKLIKKHLENGFTPLGGISYSYHEGDHILIQSLVLYEK
jgi:hypothetical protein